MSLGSVPSSSATARLPAPITIKDGSPAPAGINGRAICDVTARGSAADGERVAALANGKAARAQRFDLDDLDAAAPFAPPPGSRVFLLDVYCGDTGAKSRLACVQPKDSADRFAPLHFGRDLLARALGQPHKAHWKACERAKADETELCEKFKRVVE